MEPIHFHFQTRSVEGAIIEQSSQRSPCVVEPEDHSLCPPIQERLQALEPGEETTFLMNTEQLFGQRQNKLRSWWPRQMFSENIAEGDQVKLTLPFATLSATVQQLSEDRVLLDANHPLSEELLEYRLQRTP